jgi:hypothetical protein
VRFVENDTIKAAAERRRVLVPHIVDRLARLQLFVKQLLLDVAAPSRRRPVSSFCQVWLEAST